MEEKNTYEKMINWLLKYGEIQKKIDEFEESVFRKREIKGSNASSTDIGDYNIYKISSTRNYS